MTTTYKFPPLERLAVPGLKMAVERNTGGVEPQLKQGEIDHHQFSAARRPQVAANGREKGGYVGQKVKGADTEDEVERVGRQEFSQLIK